MLYYTIKFALKRMLKDYTNIILLVIVPLGIITIIALAFAEDKAVIDASAAGMTIAFQIFGGFYTLEFLKADLFTTKKWKIYALPCSIPMYAYGILIASTIFNGFQGLTIVLVTKLFFGVEWVSIWGVALSLLILSLFSQLVFLNILLSVKNEKYADRFGEVFAWGSVILSNYFFRMPDNVFFNTVSKYTPIKLTEDAIASIRYQSGLMNIINPLAILLVASVVLTILSYLLGRRKLV
ncbi:ABC-2 type transport system permease protein [Natranaerovirga hydrolytica]|uniref:ABC-2 type transport system permease protein n=1 Tax=Natranaerovirga hydrolytica TaxID=680378 RepID=A0A4R1MRZ4_9FIRM|nr:ABC transporter permease [Natranaerovirga hydrolytica]TCK93339.1 ABC-2 type transport system permease protein [Natranaerovirga hydrolytica]